MTCLMLRFQMFGGDGGGPSPSVLQVEPADVPALGAKLGALVALLGGTLLVGFAALWLVRGAGLWRASPGEPSGARRWASGPG